jgi:DNA-binding CsgD family transcriptional regulator
VGAASRAAHATASAAFERAAELSEDGARMGRRLQRAAQGAVDAGRPDAALALADRAQPLLEAPMDLANLNLVRSAVAGRRGRPREAYDLVTEAADRLAAVDPDVAVEMALFTVAAGFQGGWGEQILGDVRERIEGYGSAGETSRFAGLLLAGWQALVDRDLAVARERLDAAMEIAERVRSASLTDFGAGPLLFYGVFICLSTGDLSRAHRLLAETLTEDRAHGGVAVIVAILPWCALMELTAGRAPAASALLAEGLEIADHLGFDNDRAIVLAIRARVAAILGRERECRECAEAALRHGTAIGLGVAVTSAHVALGELELGLGNAAEATKQFEQAGASLFPPQALLALPALVDAALRAGEPERAQRALARFAAWAPVSRESLVPAMLARCRAMLADDADEADRLFTEALAEHAGEMPAFERARTQLAFGERLRRDRRKVESRARLRAALVAFEGLGARLWAERARGELNATGQTARKRVASTRDELTPQELRIARLVADGASNRDVAAQLFVSPKTVEYHLSKVFQKLGVRSRFELAAGSLDEALALGSRD